MARHIPPRRVPRDRFVFSGGGSAGGIFGGASVPGAHTHLEVDITDLDKFSQAAADARFAPISHTHLEADITDLDKFSQAAADARFAPISHTHIFANLTDSIANGQVPVGAVTQHQAALAIAFSQITGTVDADLLDGLDSTAFALTSHTHLEADITDLQDYFLKTGGTITGNVVVQKGDARFTLDSSTFAKFEIDGAAADAFLHLLDNGVVKFIVGNDVSSAKFKINAGGSFSRNDFTMDSSGNADFGVSLKVGGTAVSLVGHTHLEADITDLRDYLLKTGGTLTGDLALDFASPTLSFKQSGILRLQIKLLGAGTDGGNMRLFTRPDGGALTETLRLTTNNIVVAFAGARLQVQDATGADSGLWSHDGTDFNLTLVNTTDYNITGLSNLVVSGQVIAENNRSFRAKGTAPEYILEETDGPVDEKIWGFRATVGQLTLRTINDAFSVASNWLTVDRTGITGDKVTILTTQFQVNSTIGFNGTTPITKPTIIGTRSGHAAIANLLTALANYGLITDNTSP